MNRKYLVGDTNGAFLSNEGVTDKLEEAKEYNSIGDAMRDCIRYNKNTYSFRVIPNT